MEVDALAKLIEGIASVPNTRSHHLYQHPITHENLNLIVFEAHGERFCLKRLAIPHPCCICIGLMLSIGYLSCLMKSGLRTQ